nr:probable peroxidase 61 isoform X3 [Nicotiana tomentosiformis]XP_033516896.1 probable peroxidase 61 isoform X3 [Nicotiana tomentosiformis]
MRLRRNALGLSLVLISLSLQREMASLWYEFAPYPLFLIVQQLFFTDFLILTLNSTYFLFYMDLFRDPVQGATGESNHIVYVNRAQFWKYGNIHNQCIMAGGLYYPVLTGRRDSKESFFDEAMPEISRPDGNITETLKLFSLRGFDERETVALLGGHNIGKIGCEFIRPRLSNFMGTGLPDPTIPSDFLEELMRRCPDDNSTINNMLNEHIARGLSESAMSYSQGLSALSSVGTSFDNHY